MLDLRVNEYLELLKSDAPAPGGGSASAFTGAQGMALVMMVANLTIGRERYKEFWEVNEKVLRDGDSVLKELSKKIEEDTESYKEVMKAYAMKKDTEEEKALRAEAIKEAVLLATKVPFSVMELAIDGLNIAKTIVGKSNLNCASDLGVSALMFLAMLKGAWLNVLTNLPGIKNPDMEISFKDKGEKIYKEAEALANSIYEEVKNNL